MKKTNLLLTMAALLTAGTLVAGCGSSTTETTTTQKQEEVVVATTEEQVNIEEAESVEPEVVTEEVSVVTKEEPATDTSMMYQYNETTLESYEYYDYNVRMFANLVWNMDGSIDVYGFYYEDEYMMDETLHLHFTYGDDGYYHDDNDEYMMEIWEDGTTEIIPDNYDSEYPFGGSFYTQYTEEFATGADDPIYVSSMLEVTEVGAVYTFIADYTIYSFEDANTIHMRSWNEDGTFYSIDVSGEFPILATGQLYIVTATFAGVDDSHTPVFTNATLEAY